jgi:hypothetical protein
MMTVRMDEKTLRDFKVITTSSEIDCGSRIADCGLKKISIVASQPAVPGGRFGINNPQSAIRDPQSEDPQSSILDLL